MARKPKEWTPIDTTALSWVTAPESSLIARFAYDVENRVLAIEFNSGDEYQYFDVDPAVYEEMQAAPSKGRFFGSTVRGQHPYRRTG